MRRCIFFLSAIMIGFSILISKSNAQTIDTDNPTYTFSNGSSISTISSGITNTSSLFDIACLGKQSSQPGHLLTTAEGSYTGNFDDATKGETVTINNLNVIGVFNVNHDVIVENLEINTAGTTNFANGATLTINGYISNQFRIGIIAHQPIILRSGIKIN